MIQRYKVLGAMLALDEFTTRTLANFTGLKEPTVRTVIGREKRLVEKIGEQKTGHRGGSFDKYRVRADQVASLRAEITDLYKSLPPLPGNEATGETNVGVPLGLLMAEDAVERLVPLARNHEEKIEILELAKANIESGQSEFGRMTGTMAEKEKVDARFHAVDTMQRLTEAEVLWESGQRPDRLIDFPKLVDDLERARSKLVGLGETGRVQEILERIQKTPLSQVTSSFPAGHAGPEKGQVSPDVLIVDAIEDGIDRLTPYVEEILNSGNIRNYVVKIVSKDHESLRKTLQRTIHGRTPAYTCIVTVNSSAGDPSYTFQQVHEICSPRRTFVLDVDYSDKLRNELYNAKAMTRYESHVADLEPTALLNALKLNF